MSVHQVEEYYVSLDSSEIDFSRVDEIDSLLEDYPCTTVSIESDYVMIEGFDSEGSAEDGMEQVVKGIGI